MDLRQPLQLSKRQRIVIAATLITIGLLSTQTINFQLLRYRFIIGLSFLAYLLSLWALKDGITKFKAIVLLILPTLFTLGVVSFYFLLPVRWLTRLPVALMFGLSFYSLLLSQNVFNVAAQRTIPLYRAASTVSFLFTLVTAFFLFNVVFSFKLFFYWNFILTFLISFPLILQILWAIQMDKLTPQILIYTFVLSLVVGELSLALSFWPVIPTVLSLTLSTVLYVLLGITSHFLRGRINTRLVLEYLGVGVTVFLFTLFSTSWVG